jgi:hypothetical protein
MAAASLLAFPYTYSVYPHLDGLNIGPHRRTTRSPSPCSIPGADVINGPVYGPDGRRQIPNPRSVVR